MDNTEFTDLSKSYAWKKLTETSYTGRIEVREIFGVGSYAFMVVWHTVDSENVLSYRDTRDEAIHEAVRVMRKYLRNTKKF